MVLTISYKGIMDIRKKVSVFAIFLFPMVVIVIYRLGLEKYFESDAYLPIIIVVAIYLAFTGCLFLWHHQIYDKKSKIKVLGLAIVANLMALTILQGIDLWQYALGIDIRLDYISQIAAIIWILSSLISLLLAYWVGYKVLRFKQRK